jgi:anti-anti-sigma regulatory factor
MSDVYQFSLHESLPLVIVKITGYGNEETLSPLAPELEEHLKAGKNRVILDFASCQIINSTGLSTLLELLMGIKDEHGGQIWFCGMSQLLVDAFEFSGVMSLVEPCATLDEALKLAETAS